MALFSDIDWIILLGVGGLLLLGPNNPQLLRTVGRWYGRAMRLKQELLSEVSRAAEIPSLADGRAPSLRSTLLGLDEAPAGRSAVPVAVATVPVLAGAPPPSMTWVNSVGPQQWSVVSAPVFERRREGE